MKKIVTALLLSVVCFLGNDPLIFAQPALSDENPLTQEQFAVELVKLLKIENLLPPAALPGDCAGLLGSFGIAPLKGWDNKSLLKQEDYLVLIGIVQGKEQMLHQRAVEAEEANIAILNKQWEKAKEDSGRWLSLDELLNSKEYFPNGAPQSPYGIKYSDRNNDHKIDAFQIPVAKLVDIRQFLAAGK